MNVENNTTLPSEGGDHPLQQDSTGGSNANNESTTVVAKPDAGSDDVLIFDAATGEEVNNGGEDEGGEALTGTDQDGAKLVKKGVQPRIDELTRQRHEAEREAKYWRDLAQGRGANSGQETAPKEPNPADFEHHNDYVKALTKWTAAETVKEQLANDNSAKVTQSIEQQRQQNWQTRSTQVAAKIPDYHDVMSKSTVEIQPHVVDILLDSKHGPALGYHLAKNPEVAVKLNNMSPRAAALEVGEIIGSRMNRGTNSGVAPRHVSNAPVPARSSVGGNRSTEIDASKLSMDDYAAQRKARKSSRG